MNTYNIIVVDLIVEDLCLQQLLIGMENIGLKSQYEPCIQRAIAALMQITTEEKFDDWFNRYCPIYEKALLLKFQDKNALRVLAENYLIHLNGFHAEQVIMLSNQ